jgi:lactoylglutathione lyase
MKSYLSYLVLRCADLEISKTWFEALGLSTTREQHQGGPVHYSIAIGDLVLELYPLRERATSGLRIGLHVQEPRMKLKSALLVGGKLLANELTLLVEDPDGHTFELLPP